MTTASAFLTQSSRSGRWTRPVGTWETDRRGRFYAPLEAGDYDLVETRAGEGYRLDDTPIYFTVADNSTTTKRVTNKAFTGILIHKVDSVSGRGVPGVSFLVYDGRMNPIDQVTTDQKGLCLRGRPGHRGQGLPA